MCQKNTLLPNLALHRFLLEFLHSTYQYGNPSTLLDLLFDEFDTIAILNYILKKNPNNKKLEGFLIKIRLRENIKQRRVGNRIAFGSSCKTLNNNC
jgi:hypothetical protein